MLLYKFLRFFLARLRVFTLVASVAVCVYFVARVIIFSYSDYTALEKLFALMLLTGETYMLVHALGYMVNVFHLRSREEQKPAAPLEQGKDPWVAVVVAARHEPKQILEETLITFRNLDYPNKNIYFLDDSSDQRFKDEADELARRHGVKVFRRDERRGAKAGIVNAFMAGMTEKYLAIFDADQNPMPDFLSDLLPALEADDNLAFVQTPQFYSNVGDSPVAMGAAMQQAIFYESICEGKDLNDAMFCCGTNVVFRRSALLAVGGFDETSITEDFATSVKLHAKGYRSLYYPHVKVFGLGPDTLPAYFKQQARWSGGTVSVFRRVAWLLLRSPRSLTFMQWVEYFLAGSYYFVGWAFFFLMVCPVAYLLFNVPSFFLDPEIYIATFVPYFSLSLLVFYATMHERHYTLKQIYTGLILGSLCFPVLMKATLLGLIGKKMTFVVTTKGGRERLDWTGLWPYGVMMGLNIAAIVVGALRFETAPYAIGVNMFWAAYHVFILANIFRFNQPQPEGAAA
ncbi:MAG TPA: glycosyltransferase [Elusimicrobiales bacterium]|nr:glycosyltransferase [Elusimicrobiales bacterium]